MTGKIGIGIGLAKKGLGLLGKVKNKVPKPSPVIKSWGHGGSKKAAWEIEANRKEMENINKNIKIMKNVGKGVVGTIAAATVAGKIKSNKLKKERAKKNKDKE